MYLDDKRKELPIKWRFLSSYNWQNTAEFVAGDLIMVLTGSDYEIKEVQQDLSVIDYVPQQGWKIINLITRNKKGDKIIVTTISNEYYNYFLIIEKCCSSSTSPECLPTSNYYNNTGATFQADVDVTNDNSIITLNGQVQEVHPSWHIASIVNGLITWNPGFEPVADDIICIRKRCGTVALIQVSGETNSLQSPLGYENAYIITLNGQVQEVHPNWHIASIVDGLITWNLGFEPVADDIVVFRL